MSHTIRNERTKGYLDKLAHRRKMQKEARDMKAQSLNYEFDLDIEKIE